MCRPRAIGSKQANSTICARWRGGNPGGPPGTFRSRQETGQARVLVTAAGPPDGRAIALCPDGQLMDRFPGRDAQDDPSPLDLKPGEGSAVGDLVQSRDIVWSDPQGERFSTPHRAPPVAELRTKIQRTGCAEFVAVFRARDTRRRVRGPTRLARFA